MAAVRPHPIGEEISRSFWQWFSRLEAAATDSVRYSRNNMAAIGAVGFFSYPIYFFVWRELFPQDYENLTLRILGSLLCAPLMLIRYWPDRWERYLPTYFIVCVIYCLPFFFSFMLLQNAEVTYGTAEPGIVWQMSLVVALVLLVMLINDGLLIAIAFVVGTLGAWGLLAGLNESIHLEPIRSQYLAPMPVYLFILVGGSIYNHHRDTVQQEMLRAVSAVGSNIAHELRTPLLGIKSDARGLQRYLPHLMEGYEQAREAGLPVKPIRASHLSAMSRSLERIDSETEFANTIIDMLLINSGGNTVRPSEFARFSASECVTRALDRFPFASENERRLIHVADGQDFYFRGSDILLMHVVFNLLKNSLYYIASAGKGEVFIWFESQGSSSNRMFFMDTAAGIAPNVLPRIFERFYTSMHTGRGSGIGLSFCKMVMKGFGGDITCESEYGEYARFILTFPGADVDA